MSAAASQAAPASSSPATPEPSPHNRRRNPPSLRTYVARTLGGVAALLTIGLCLVFGELMKYRSQQQAGATLQAVADHSVTMLHQVLRTQSRRVQELSRVRGLWSEGFDSPRALDALQWTHHLAPQSVWVDVSDPQGVIQASTMPEMLGTNVRGVAWFDHGLKSAYISDVTSPSLLGATVPSATVPSAATPAATTSAAGVVPDIRPDLRGARQANAAAAGAATQNMAQMLLDFSAPIVGEDGQLIGVLSQHTRWGWVHDVVERVLTGQESAQMQTFIFDDDGQIIYAPQASMAAWALLGQRLPQDLAGALDYEQRRHYALVRWKDRSDAFLTAVARLPVLDADHDLGWWVVTRQPIEVAYAGANRIAYVALLIGVLAGAVTALIAWLLARHVSKDLNTLAQAAQRINHSIELDSREPIPVLHSTLEVQQLSQTLSGMTEGLLRANQEMSRIVDERTRALQQANAELQRQAHTDPLTKLLNRRGFDAKAEMIASLAQRSGRPLSVISFDIDHFKRINDNYGHDVGDKVLQALAAILRERVRIADIVARFGGEEFVVLLPDTPAEGALELTNHILEYVRRATIEPVGRITVSAGISGCNPAEGIAGVANALKRSDEALYEAKEGGRDRACVRNPT